MAKTYLPTLLRLVRAVCLYTQRYDRIIRDNLDGDALTAYEAFRLACDAFVVLIPVEGEIF